MSRVSTRLARSTRASRRSVLAARERDLDALGIDQPPARRLEGPAREAERLRPHRLPPLRRLAGAAQHRADAREQLARVEGLGEIVVRSELEADDAVRLLAHRREHDDRHVGLAPHPACEVEPTLPRQHQIEDDEVEMGVRPSPPRLARVAHGGHPEPVALEEAGQQLADLAVVVNDQDVLGGLHGSRS